MTHLENKWILKKKNLKTLKYAFLVFSSPGHDYSFSSLSKIKDNIHINIFDEVVIEKHEVT
jgi:hypothetical protein